MSEQPSAPRADGRPSVADPAVLARYAEYWRSNLRIMAVLLCVWAFVSLGCGVLFADWLNRFRLPGTGYPLGFWFA
ncbi:MAG TPA: DUF4212 domain-containing protein, partial [Longimicrobiales bacterium]|nr:DUF4212 domain-containing protein [Longimicrobiales bacterium]